MLLESVERRVSPRTRDGAREPVCAHCETENLISFLGGKMDKTAAELVADAKSHIENLDPDAVERELGNGDAVLVDIRDAPELDEHGRIAGAVHVPRGMLEFRADVTSHYHLDPLDPSKRVILHCASGGRSALAARTLQEMGYRKVAHLDGGINAWKDAGKPVG